MKDFLTDEEMAQLSAAPSQAPTEAPQSDFMTDEQMAQMSPNHPDEASTGAVGGGPVMSDEQMTKMEHPDHAKVNEMIRQAISRGMTKQQIIALAEANGVPNAAGLSDELAPALAWRKVHPDYRGKVEVFGDRPEVRTQPGNEVGALEAVGAGTVQGLTFDSLDEIGAGIGAASNAVAGLVGGGTGEGIGDYYTRVRDENRAYLHDAEDQHGAAYMGGNILGSIAPAAVGGLGVSGLRLAGRAALEGGAYGVGGSEADTVGGVAGDALTGGLVGGLTAGTLNRAGAVISPQVAPLVNRLMRAGVELTPTQILRAGGPVSRAAGHVIEKVGGRGAVTREAMRGAEQRGVESVDRIQLAQDAAVEAARRAGLNATPRHADLIGDARQLMGKPVKEASNVELMGNLLLGYGSGWTTTAADLGVASAFTKPGQRVVNSALTGSWAGKSAVPKSLRSISTKLSPFAANATTSNLPYNER